MSPGRRPVVAAFLGWPVLVCALVSCGVLLVRSVLRVWGRVDCSVLFLLLRCAVASGRVCLCVLCRLAVVFVVILPRECSVIWLVCVLSPISGVFGCSAWEWGCPSFLDRRPCWVRSPGLVFWLAQHLLHTCRDTVLTTTCIQ